MSLRADSGLEISHTCVLTGSDDAQKLRQLETEKKLRRWQLCRWPRYDVAPLIPTAAPGAGKWETLSMDLDTLQRLKGTLDMHFARRSPQAEREAGDEDGVAEDEKGDGATVGAKLDAEGAGKEESDKRQSRSQDRADTTAAGSRGADMELDNEGDAALVAVADLAGKVLANIAAERERKKKAEELRKLAEAEVSLVHVPRLKRGGGGDVSGCPCAFTRLRVCVLVIIWISASM